MVEITGFTLILALYVLVNVIAFFVYAYDKRKARNNTWRTSENTLLFIAFFGPFGAYGAMRMFRHKTQKIKFYLVPFFLIIHIVVIGYIALMILQGDNPFAGVVLPHITGIR